MLRSTKSLLTVFALLGRRKPAALLGALVAGLPMLWLRGFTVDDALISARVAHQLATGHGYRFNAGGAVVDAVTPLGWAPMLSLFAAGGVWPALVWAKWIGAAAWLSAAAYVGWLLAPFGARALAVGLLALGVTGPLAVWAVSGMETGLVTALCTFGLGRGRFAPLLLGAAAGLRPELLPWVLTLNVARAVVERTQPTGWSRVVVAGACALVPFVAVAVVRRTTFGEAYPLAVLAKPSDLEHGLRYALGALAFSGPVWLLVAWRDYLRCSALARVSAVGVLVHALSLVIAGGDWMPFYRLFVPVLPSVVLAAAELTACSASRIAVGVRVSAMLAVSALLLTQLGPSAGRVGEQRAALIRAAAPVLAQSKRVAALDVGWVGAATAAEIIDLAGVTDPSIAALPGGHTSKRLPSGLLELRDVDTVVLLATSPELTAWPNLALARRVETRVRELAGFERFRPVAALPLLGTDQAYVVARRDRAQP